MKRFDRTNGTPLVAAVCTALICSTVMPLFSGCSEPQHLNNGPIDSSGKEIPNTVKHIQTIDASYIRTTVEDCWEKSDMVCVGRFKEQSAPFLIDPVGDADPCYFTDFFFEVDEVLKGSLPLSALENDNTIIVRQKGGIGNALATIDYGAAEPVVGERYVLNLYTIATGAEFNTEGDHFYLLGKENGLWEEVDADVFLRPGVGESVTLARLHELGGDAARQGAPRKDDNYDAFLTEVEEHYLSGDIPKSVYDQEVLRIEQLRSERARIVPQEQVAEIEQNVASTTAAA